MPPLISVGAANSDGTLRLWLAQQAVEKGEAMLAAQLASVARISASATSILGWSVTISLAMVAGISSGLVPSTALVFGCNGDAALFAMAGDFCPACDPDSVGLLRHRSLAGILASASACARPDTVRTIRHGTRGSGSPRGRLRGRHQSQSAEAHASGKVVACRVGAVCWLARSRGNGLRHSGDRHRPADCRVAGLASRPWRLLHGHRWHRNRLRLGRWWCGRHLCSS